MALQSTDLLVVQRPASKQHYKVEVGAFSSSGSGLPDGNDAGDALIWSGTQWEPSNTIDGGTY